MMKIIPRDLFFVILDELCALKVSRKQGRFQGMECLRIELLVSETPEPFRTFQNLSGLLPLFLLPL